MPDNKFILFTKPECYYIYIVTNEERTILETGVTGDIAGRLYNLAHGFHEPSVQGTCYRLLHWEGFEDVHTAMKRERELRALSFKRKKGLIELHNPEWRFLNDDLHMIS